MVARAGELFVRLRVDVPVRREELEEAVAIEVDEVRAPREQRPLLCVEPVAIGRIGEANRRAQEQSRRLL